MNSDETPSFENNGETERNEADEEIAVEGANDAGESVAVVASNVKPDESEAETDWKREYEKLREKVSIAEDISEISSLFPFAGRITKPEDIENVGRFTELRKAGLSVSEAFCATNSARLFAGRESKEHLGSGMLREAAPMPQMSRSELELAREIFGDEISDEALLRLYRRARGSAK